MNKVEGWLTRLHDPTLVSTAEGVRKASNNYNQTDDENAASLDATMPGCSVSLGQVPRNLNEELGMPLPSFVYVRDPQSQLTPPPDYTTDPHFQWYPRYSNVFSPSAYVRSACIEVTKFFTWIGWMDGEIDPFDAWTRPVVGDWAGLRASADAFSKAGHACDDMAVNVDRWRHLMEPVWRGRSADAGVSHLGAVSSAMYQAREPLVKLSDAYKLGADAAAEFRKVVDAVIAELADLAMSLALTVAAAGGTALPSGGVSVILGGVLGAWEAGRFISLCRYVDDYRKIYEGMRDTSCARIKAQISDLDAVLPELPNVDMKSPLSQLPA